MNDRVLVESRPPLQVAPVDGEVLRIQVGAVSPVVVTQAASAPIPVLLPERPSIQVLQALMGPPGEAGVKGDTGSGIDDFAGNPLAVYRFYAGTLP